MTSDAELMLVEGAEGILAIGTKETLDEWQNSAGAEVQTRQPEGLNLSPITAGIPQLTSLGSAVPHRFLPSRPGQISPTQTAEIRRITRGPDGKFLKNELLAPTLPLGLTPQTILIHAAIEVLTESLAEIREELEEVKEGVEELLRQAEADRLGDIYGHNKVLRRVTQGLNRGDTLTSADWDALASMGPNLQIGTEKLRAYLASSIRDLDYGSPPSRRVRQLQKFMESGRFVDQLKLLVVAEESLALYQRIRLERVRNTEPESIEQTVRGIQHILAVNVEADMEVATQLNRMLNEFAVLRPAEGLEFLTRRRMDKLRAQLHETASEFVSHRAGQVDDWSMGESARIKDAFNHYKGVLDGARRKTLQVTATGLSHVAQKIDPGSEQPEDTEEQPSEN